MAVGGLRLVVSGASFFWILRIKTEFRAERFWLFVGVVVVAVVVAAGGDLLLAFA